MTKVEPNETSYVLRDTSIEKVGPYNENVKLVLGPSRVNESSRTAGSALLGQSGAGDNSANQTNNTAGSNGKSSGAGNGGSKGIKPIRG